MPIQTDTTQQPSSSVTVSAPNPNGNFFQQPTIDPMSNFSPAIADPGNLDTSNLTIPSFQTDTGTTDTSGSAIGSVLSGLTGNTGLGGLAALGADAAIAGYGLSTASGAQQQTQNQANQILGPSNALLSAGQSQLAQFQSNTLTPQQQSYVNFSTEEGQNIIQSGGALQQIAQQSLGDYASGNLNPGDQQALDASVAAQKQQVAQQMANSGMVDSSVLSAYNQQIDNQALITKQNMLNNYFTTGNQAYNSWLTSTQQGSALIASGAQFAQSAFQDMMNNALGLEGAGMTGLTTAIGLIINSDTAIQGQVSQLMSNLAAAYSYQVSGGGAGGKGGATSSLGSIFNMGKTANSTYSNLSSAWANYTASTIGPAANSASQAAAQGIINDTAPSLLGDVGDASLASSGSDAAGAAGDILGGFSSAGGAAAAGGSGAAGTAGAVSPLISTLPESAGGAAAGGAAGDAAVLSNFQTAGITPAFEASSEIAADDAGAAAAGDAAGSAGLGAAAGAALGIGGVLAPAIIGMSTPAVSLTSGYWDKVQSGLQSAISSGDKGTMAGSILGLLNQPQNQVPGDIQQLVWQTGLVPPGTWGLPNISDMSYTQIQQALGETGASTGPYGAWGSGQNVKNKG